jgi:type I restriction enzyme S subunit
VLEVHNFYNREFIFHVFKYLEPQLLRVAVKSGTTVESIDGSVLYNFPIGLPNKVEQDQIASILDGINEKIWQDRCLAEKLKEEKQGLMQDLLTGKREVKV